MPSNQSFSQDFSLLPAALMATCFSFPVFLCSESMKLTCSPSPEPLKLSAKPSDSHLDFQNLRHVAHLFCSPNPHPAQHAAQRTVVCPSFLMLCPPRAGDAFCLIIVSIFPHWCFSTNTEPNAVCTQVYKIKFLCPIKTKCMRPPRRLRG